MQRLDGGWGEDGKSYYSGFENHSKKSTPSKPAWAIMGLIAAGQIDSIEVKKGIKYLLKNNLKWEENYYTAVGFPKVFYLKYHGYAKYFPLLISKIKNQSKSNSQTTRIWCLKKKTKNWFYFWIEERSKISITKK